MKNITFKLPKTKYTVQMRPFVPWGVFREYQKRILGDADIDVTNPKSINFRVASMTAIDAQTYLIDQMVLGMHDGDKEIEDIQDTIFNLPREDGDLVFRKILDLLNGSDDEKKSS